MTSVPIFVTAAHDARVVTGLNGIPAQIVPAPPAVHQTLPTSSRSQQHSRPPPPPKPTPFAALHSPVPSITITHVPDSDHVQPEHLPRGVLETPSRVSEIHYSQDAFHRPGHTYVSSIPRSDFHPASYFSRGDATSPLAGMPCTIVKYRGRRPRASKGLDRRRRHRDRHDSKRYKQPRLPEPYLGHHYEPYHHRPLPPHVHRAPSPYDYHGAPHAHAHRAHPPYESYGAPHGYASAYIPDDVPPPIYIPPPEAPSAQMGPTYQYSRELSFGSPVKDESGWGDRDLQDPYAIDAKSDPNIRNHAVEASNGHDNTPSSHKKEFVGSVELQGGSVWPPPQTKAKRRCC